MTVKLYSTGCPKCNVMKKKLDSKKVAYEITDNFDLPISKGMRTAPVLQVDEELMDFNKANTWVNQLEVVE